MKHDIDTAIISTTNFKIKDINKWKVNEQRSNSYKTILIQNNEKISLTLTQFSDRALPILVICTSISSICHKNNFESNNIPLFLKNIISDLLEMGVETTQDAILDASVLRADFTIDFILPEGMSCVSAMNKISTTKLSRLENTQKGYKNGGNQYLLSCDSWGCSFYDKKKQMGEKLKSLIPSNVYLNQDILRMEARFSKKGTLRRWLKKAGVDIYNQIKFRDLFENNTSKKILKCIWNLIKENIPKVYEFKNATDMFDRVETQSKNIKTRLAYAFIELLKDENGTEEMRLLIESRTNKKNAYNFFNEYKKHCRINAPLKHSDITDEISRQLDEDSPEYTNTEVKN